MIKHEEMPRRYDCCQTSKTKKSFTSFSLNGVKAGASEVSAGKYQYTLEPHKDDHAACFLVAR